MKNREDEFFCKNSELSIEFSKYVLKHPEIDDLLDEEATVIFLPEFNPSLKAFNLNIAKELEEEGEKVMYIKLRKMLSKPSSRLEGVEILSRDASELTV
jgi:hypothetical protein